MVFGPLRCVLRSCNCHESAGVSFYGTGFHVAIRGVNSIKCRYAWKHTEVPMWFSIVAPTAWRCGRMCLRVQAEPAGSQRRIALPVPALNAEPNASSCSLICPPATCGITQNTCVALTVAGNVSAGGKPPVREVGLYLRWSWSIWTKSG